MTVFIVRHQGFFYTDEYFAPGGAYRQNLRTTFTTRAAAEKACAEQSRAWIRRDRLGDYVFDDVAARDALIAYLRATWPDEHGSLDRRGFYDTYVPEDATDAQVDEILRLAKVELAKVFEVAAADPPHEDEEEGELYFGPDERDREYED